MTVEVDNKWNTDDYNHCEDHDLYYKKYCLWCNLGYPKFTDEEGQEDGTKRRNTNDS